MAKGVLLPLVESGLTEARRSLPLLPGTGYIRASSLATRCPRAEVLASRHGVVREDVEDATSLLTYAHGHGLHYALQNHVLPKVGVLIGKWICLDCGKVYGAPGETTIRVEDGLPPLELDKILVPRPEKCERCHSKDFHYREIGFSAPDYSTGGHPDGYLRVPGMEGLGLLEAKSTQKIWEVRATPYIEHVLQVQTYLWFTGLLWAVILYWAKDGQGPSALVEHLVLRDEETIASIKAMLATIWDGVGGGAIPEPLCQSKDAPRAKRCALRGYCFAEDPCPPTP